MTPPVPSRPWLRLSGSTAGRMRVGLDFVGADGETIGSVMLHGGANGFAHVALDLAPDAWKHRRIVIQGFVALACLAKPMGLKAVACGVKSAPLARMARMYGFTPSGYVLPGYSEIWIKRLAGGHEMSDAMVARACFPDAARAVLMLRETLRLTGAPVVERLLPKPLRRLVRENGQTFLAPPSQHHVNALEALR